ncbi:MAG: hypothetical protein ACD_37C00024G0003 [uncultured bacterium]|nr:MAG: hypothetical protein ACD_37C00024G0003 [uncultured bacterium]KKP96252.1 MAG: hypothetical protein US02_C0003G0006 [Candidatus Levybacteria bacterium GW2011_GWA2_36_13]KKQ58254.1 MAG: hypothetical protein US77_C0005G0019 [Microgenomates group bacterium GW2011_GWC1_38_14]KKR17320.1 MAG: hypothetical protein UT44_C0009G0018 [Candidatus Levybacteria bacterium GW2011_GWA1_39_32]OGH43990.1 MAG: hypothetical protein A3I49_00585 [Candidatus Levybacteria bacterium RIFCSPLOWO2_02_FULL_37_11]
MNNHQGGRFMDGFILGLLVGGIAVFLFGTEKGKKVLKVLKEEGVFDFEEERVAKILPNVKKKAEEISEKAKKKIEETLEEVSEFDDLNEEASNGHSSQKSPVRRFFKRK